MYYLQYSKTNKKEVKYPIYCQYVAKRNFNHNFFVVKMDTMQNSNPASSTDQYKLTLFKHFNI